MTYQLRDYQETVLQQLFAWFYQHPTGNPVVSVSVGGGKSVLIAEFCRRVITQWPNQRILMVVASRELVAQNYEKLKAIYPESDAGLYSAGLGKKNPHAKIVFATIASIYNKAMYTGAFDVCIVDECHLVSPRGKEVGMYRQMISEYTRLNPHFRTIGFTGSPFRGNGVLITSGDNVLFNDIAAEVSMRSLLDEGYLSPLVLSETQTKTDVTDVHINAMTGDYNVAELAKAIDRDDITKAAVAEIIAAGHDRKHWLIFGVDIQHCEHIYQELTQQHIKAGVVHSKTPKNQRDLMIKRFKEGIIQALVNVCVLTTGFDMPGIDLIALIRNTKSPVLYLQIAGRGLRTAKGKINCKWLDFTDTTENLGPVDQLKGHKEIKSAKKEPPKKECPACGSKNHGSATHCICGFEFTINHTITINSNVSDAAVLSVMQQANLLEIKGMFFAQHTKEDKPTSLCVTYRPVNLAGIAHKEWVCFEHQGYARRKAENWWLKMQGNLPFPNTVQEAINRKNELTEPTAICVIKNGKFYEVNDHVFPTTVSNAQHQSTNYPESGSITARIAQHQTGYAL
jgi:DNA repair protein RadD